MHPRKYTCTHTYRHIHTHIRHKRQRYLENNVRCQAPGDLTMSDDFDANDDLNTFSNWYSHYHGYVSLCVCVGGIVTNTFNFIVLTRKHMRTPVNQILTGLAVSDIITMLSYLPFAIHFYCIHPSSSQSPERNSKGWMSFLLFHISLTTVTHTISIWLCVVLAIVRYLHIRSPTRASSIRLRRNMQARYLVIGTYIISILVMIPNYLTNELKAKTIQDRSSLNETLTNETRPNMTFYYLENIRLGSNDTNPLVLANVWMYAVLAKLIPCCLITIFGSLLLYQMRTKLRQRKDFLKVSASNNHKLNEHSRTTMMLMTVIVLFLITELPQGILIVLSACKEGFFNSVYMPLGDVMDIGALVNNAINFVLYCSMSAKFRQTFLKLFCRCERNCDLEENGYVLREDKNDSYSNNNELENVL
ncbi:G-protein coupled receptor 139 [Biomphalaria pfeifferi]|uniref:G-protein coupled receptor 139 n=1 Tax=Biomphalaria pfeifferi TaxID=112525 RepID=A0AAD8BKP2_BIOPF|nr:G-protein coupled receptor 139 [Biomphalaria pfeifferi]